MGLYQRAELLSALWRLGAEDELLPTSHGILDKALNDTFDVLPKVLQDGLTFRVSGVGLRAYEFPDILLAAQEALLTSEPNPTYLKTVVTLDEDSARQIVLGNGISTAQAKEIGGKIANAVSRIEKEMRGTAMPVTA